MLLLLNMDEEVKNQKTADAALPISSTGNKERQGKNSYIENANQGPQITNDISQFVVPSEPSVPEHLDVGVKPSAEATPVKTEPTGAVSLPMTEKEAKEVLKTSSSSLNLHEIQEGEYTEDSKPFLAALIEKFFQKMRGLVKKPA